MKSCIDLRDRFGHSNKVAYEESYQAERGERARSHDPWLLVIPCHFGHIYPQGGALLGASTNCRGPIANRLASLPCIRVVQDGDDGINVVFQFSDFDKVAAIMKPRRRRKLTPEQRTERTERLRKYQFRSAIHNAHSARRRDRDSAPGSRAA